MDQERTGALGVSTALRCRPTRPHRRQWLGRTADASEHKGDLELGGRRVHHPGLRALWAHCAPADPPTRQGRWSRGRRALDLVRIHCDRVGCRDRPADRRGEHASARRPLDGLRIGSARRSSSAQRVHSRRSGHRKVVLTSSCGLLPEINRCRPQWAIH